MQIWCPFWALFTVKFVKVIQKELSHFVFTHPSSTHWANKSFTWAVCKIVSMLHSVGTTVHTCSNYLPQTYVYGCDVMEIVCGTCWGKPERAPHKHCMWWNFCLYVQRWSLSIYSNYSNYINSNYVRKFELRKFILRLVTYVDASISRRSIVHFSRHSIAHFLSLNRPFLSSLDSPFLVTWSSTPSMHLCRTKKSATPNYIDQSQARWPSIEFQYRMYVGGKAYSELEQQIRLTPQCLYISLVFNMFFACVRLVFNVHLYLFCSDNVVKAMYEFEGQEGELSFVVSGWHDVGLETCTSVDCVYDNPCLPVVQQVTCMLYSFSSWWLFMSDGRQHWTDSKDQ